MKRKLANAGIVLVFSHTTEWQIVFLGFLENIWPWYFIFNLCKQLQKHLSQIEKAFSWKPAGNAHGNFPHAVAILKIPPCKPTILMINSGTVSFSRLPVNSVICVFSCMYQGEVVKKKKSFTTFSNLHLTNNLPHFPLEIQGFLQIAQLTNITVWEMLFCG